MKMSAKTNTDMNLEELRYWADANVHGARAKDEHGTFRAHAIIYEACGATALALGVYERSAPTKEEALLRYSLRLHERSMFGREFVLNSPIRVTDCVVKRVLLFDAVTV